MGRVTMEQSVGLGGAVLVLCLAFRHRFVSVEKRGRPVSTSDHEATEHGLDHEDWILLWGEGAKPWGVVNQARSEQTLPQSSLAKYL
jgi:hypothetical protein